MYTFKVQFLKKAVDILCQCRQTLMYTYVFAFYLRKNNQSVIFEDNQRDLERATEILSEYLERDITSENLADIKQKVQDKYRYVFIYPFTCCIYQINTKTVIHLSGTVKTGGKFYSNTYMKATKKIVGITQSERCRLN